MGMGCQATCPSGKDTPFLSTLLDLLVLCIFALPPLGNHPPPQQKHNILTRPILYLVFISLSLDT